MPSLTAEERRLVMEELGNQLDTHAERLAPWFFDNLPEYYFRTHTFEEQVEHLRSLISGQVTREGRTVAIRNPEKTKVTYLYPGKDIAGFLGRLQDLERSNVVSAAMYESFDSTLRLDDFTLHEADPHPSDESKIQRILMKPWPPRLLATLKQKTSSSFSSALLRSTLKNSTLSEQPDTSTLKTPIVDARTFMSA